jgi:uncharacterized delta-60 repeat protein
MVWAMAGCTRLLVAASLMLTYLVMPMTALAAAGGLDPSFDGDGKVTTDFGPGRDDANALAIYPSGKIVAAGNTDVPPQVGRGFLDFALARYNPDGSLDPGFDGDGRVTTDFGGCEVPWAVAIQTGGKIVVGGHASAADPGTTNCGGAGLDFALARYNADGSLDQSFGDDGMVVTDFGEADDGSSENIFALAIQPDGKIVAAGSALLDPNSFESADFALARFNPDGTLDQGFDGDGRVTTNFGGFDTPFGTVLKPNGAIVAAGSTSDASGESDFALARYLRDGTLDLSFDSDGKVTTEFGGIDSAAGVAMSLRGKIVVAGSTSDLGPGDFALASYNSDGSLDTSFDGDGKVTADFGGSEFAAGVSVQPNGTIQAAGFRLGNDEDFALASFEGDGSLDPSFDGDGKVTTDFGGDDRGAAVATAPGGAIVVAGSHTLSGLDRTFALARYLPR